MLSPSKKQKKEIKKELKLKLESLNAFSFKELSNPDEDNAVFREAKIIPKDVIMLLLGKAKLGQNLGVSAILSDLKINKVIADTHSRSSFIYRLSQIDPEIFQESLINLNKPKITNNFIKCYFDGTSLELPNQKKIEAIYPKTKSNKGYISKNPMAKIHYLLSANENCCLDFLMKNHSYSERCALVELGIRANDKNIRLHVIADRGLFGAATGYYLQHYGHKFSLRCGGELIKKFKKQKFKNDSIDIDLDIYRSIKKAYKSLNIEISDKKFRCRIVRKKGSTTRKAIYIMTNDYEMSADEILGEYRGRQRIEDHFKYLKSYGGIESIHPNTKLQMIRLIISTVLFYISIMEKILYHLIPTPRPDQKGEYTANRKLSWNLFFMVLVNYKNDKYLISFQKEVLSNLLLIRPGRRAERYEISIRRTKKKAEK
jgi:stalled ribosome alternative rescue factor ArfA